MLSHLWRLFGEFSVLFLYDKLKNSTVKKQCKNYICDIYRSAKGCTGSFTHTAPRANMPRIYQKPRITNAPVKAHFGISAAKGMGLNLLNALKKKYGQYWQLYIFLLIPLAYIIIFKYIPMLGIQLAFRKYTSIGGIWNSPWVGFSNFVKFFNSYQFERIIVNTLRMSAYSIFAGFPIPIIFALMLNTVRHARYKKTVQTITYMPHFISQVIMVGILMQIFNPTYGILPQFIKVLFGVKVGDIFASPMGTVHLYVWSGIWQDFGWGSIMYLAALTNVNPELHEAAEIDGASRFQRVRHIDFPSIFPTITIMLILRMGSVMSIGFEKIYLMRNTLNQSTTEVIATYEYLRGIGSTTGNNDYSLSTTIGLFNSVINMILLATVNFASKRLSDNSLW